MDQAKVDKALRRLKWAKYVRVTVDAISSVVFIGFGVALIVGDWETAGVLLLVSLCLNLMLITYGLSRRLFLDLVEAVWDEPVYDTTGARKGSRLGDLELVASRYPNLIQLVIALAAVLGVMVALFIRTT